MIYTKKFTTETDYKSYRNKSNHPIRLVAFTEEDDKARIGDCFTVVYNVTDIENTTNLGFQNGSPKNIIIDGEQIPVVGAYQFDTLGEHTAYMYFPSLNQYCFRSPSIKTIVFPNFIKTVPYRGMYGCGAEWKNIDHIEEIVGGASCGIQNETVYMPSLKSLGSVAFNGCPMKTFIAENLESIGQTAFASASQLCNDLYFPKIKNVEYRAFHSCVGLKHVTLGENCTYIGSGAFWFTNAMESVTILATTPPTGLDSVTFAKNTSSANRNYPIYVPDEAVEDYKAAEAWSSYIDRIKPLSEKPIV